MSLNTYDPANVNASLGTVPISGYAPDSFLTVEFNADHWTVQIGADGKGNTRSKSNDRSATITFSLLQHSISHDLLTALYQADELSNTGLGQLYIRDNTTGATFTARNAWVKKPPTASFGAEAQAWDWTVETDRLIAVYGDSTFRTP